jgi:hypothetical protein
MLSRAAMVAAVLGAVALLVYLVSSDVTVTGVVELGDPVITYKGATLP